MLPHGLDYIEDGFIKKKNCAGCGLSIAEHEGCYGCSGCDYAAHKGCAKLPTTILSHPCAVRSDEPPRLTLRPLSSLEDHCFYCQQPVHGGAADPYYRWTNKRLFPFQPIFFMHASCALIPLPTIIISTTNAGDDTTECKYICHRHQMSLVVEKDEEEVEWTMLRACFSCGVPQWGFGAVFRCMAWPRCKNFFHKSCTELPRVTRHPNHGGGAHDLRLAIGRPLTCMACGKAGCRHVYRCTSRRRRMPMRFEECNAFVLGAECVFNNTILPQILVTSHKHELLLAEGRPSAFRCDGCQKSQNGSGDVVHEEVRRTWDISFRCKECFFNLHFLCGPLPSMIKFSYHIHPRRLVDMLVEDDSGEYYCDVCEEEREPRFRVYHCAKCKFIAHIHCLHSEIMKILKEGSTMNVNFVIFGESSQNGSATIDPIKAVSLGNPYHENSMAVVKDILFSTIVDGLSEEEKKKLQVMISELDPTYDKVFNQSRRLMRFIDGNKEQNINDVDAAKEYFHLNSAKFYDLCSIMRHIPHKCTKLEDKYQSMKVVEVKGYMVPWALTSDLIMLLDRYGDLGEDSTLTMKMKSYAATLLCAAVNKMRNTMAQDMSIDDVKYLFYNLNLAKKIAGYKVLNLDCFQESVMASFLGFEAIRLKKDTLKSLDLKIATSTTELENYKGKREKFKELVTTESYFIKECLRRASRSKWKTIDKFL